MNSELSRKGYRIEKLVQSAQGIVGLLPIFDHLRTLPGMSLCADLDSQIAYVDQKDLDLYVVHNLDSIADEPNGGKGIIAIAGVKHLLSYRYEPHPYVYSEPGSFGLKNIERASELCCLTVLPTFVGKGIAKSLTLHRLDSLPDRRKAVIELRPSEESRNRLDKKPEAHASTKVVQDLAKSLGFIYAGRALADNSMVLVAPF